MSRIKTLGLAALYGLLVFTATAGTVQAGLLDRLFGRETKPGVARAQSHPGSEYSSDEFDPECFCRDEDHNPHPRSTVLCRKKCGATYYPAMPPYCAPCWGVYPTCWRRAQECWVCPQERWSSKPSRPQGLTRDNVPPTAGPYIPPAPESSTPLAPSADDGPPEASPMIEEVLPQEELPPPQSRRAPAGTIRPVAAQSGLGASSAVPPAPRRPAAPATRPAKNKSIEELLQDLQ